MITKIRKVKSTNQHTHNTLTDVSRSMLIKIMQSQYTGHLGISNASNSITFETAVGKRL